MVRLPLRCDFCEMPDRADVSPSVLVVILYPLRGNSNRIVGPRSAATARPAGALVVDGSILYTAPDHNAKKGIEMRHIGLLIVLLVSFCLSSNAEEPPSTPADVAEWQKSADQGDADAQALLGYCYSNGEGVPKDYKQAVVWYQKAADQGLADAQALLGACYHFGEGVPKDYVAAY